jgi:GTPase involved in cell partitioning and DNA repair
MVEATAENPKAEADILIEELNQYSSILAKKPKCFLLTKTDLFPDNSFPAIKGWHAISSVAGHGVDDVIHVFKELIDKVDEAG